MEVIYDECVENPSFDIVKLIVTCPQLDASNPELFLRFNDQTEELEFPSCAIEPGNEGNIQNVIDSFGI